MMLTASVQVATYPSSPSVYDAARSGRTVILQPASDMRYTSSSATKSKSRLCPGRTPQPLSGGLHQLRLSSNFTPFSKKGVRKSNRSPERARVNRPLVAEAVRHAEVQSAEHAGGELRTLMVHFPTMKARVLRVWTPPGYRKPSAHEPKYPVLYLNDGQNLFEDQLCFSGVSWKAGLTAAALINSGSIPPFLIVGIDHSEGNRSYDYCPYAPGTGVSDFRPEAKSWPGGGVDAYLKGVVEEVLPFVEQCFGASEAPKLRVFGGSSFGGICAICMAMQYSAVFGKMLIESPSFWIANGKFLDDIREHKGKWPQRMFLAMGGKEYSGTRNGNRTDVDGLLSGYFKEFVQLMEPKELQTGKEFKLLDHV